MYTGFKFRSLHNLSKLLSCLKADDEKTSYFN